MGGGIPSDKPHRRCRCCRLFPPLFLLLSVFAVILSAAKKPEGVTTIHRRPVLSSLNLNRRCLFYCPKINNVISTEAAHSFIVSSAAEKSASLPQPLTHARRAFSVAPAFRIGPAKNRLGRIGASAPGRNYQAANFGVKIARNAGQYAQIKKISSTAQTSPGPIPAGSSVR
jgi:hypothetical protein